MGYLDRCWNHDYQNITKSGNICDTIKVLQSSPKIIKQYHYKYITFWEYEKRLKMIAHHENNCIKVGVSG